MIKLEQDRDLVQIASQTLRTLEMMTQNLERFMSKQTSRSSFFHAECIGENMSVNKECVTKDLGRYFP